MRTSVLCFAFAMLCVGCQRSSEGGGGSYGPGPVSASGKRPALPGADEVTEVRFTPPPDSRNGDWPPATTLKQPEAVLDAVRWLHAVDWSAKPRDTAVMGLLQPGELSYLKRDGTKATFMILNESIIAGQYMWRAETERLKQILKR
jgi:hypothetical protein